MALSGNVSVAVTFAAFCDMGRDVWCHVLKYILDFLTIILPPLFVDLEARRNGLPPKHGFVNLLEGSDQYCCWLFVDKGYVRYFEVSILVRAMM